MHVDERKVGRRCLPRCGCRARRGRSEWRNNYHADGDQHQTARCHNSDEPAERLQIHPRLPVSRTHRDGTQLRGTTLLGQRYAVGWQLSGEDITDSLAREASHSGPGLHGGAPNVGQESDSGSGEQARVDRRLPLEDIQTGPENGPRFQGIDQGVLVDNGTSSGIDQHCRWLHECELVGSDHVVGAFAERDMETDHVGPSKELME